MIGLYYFYIYVQFIIVLGNFCDANPLLGKNVKPAKKGEFPFIVSLSLECPTVEKEFHFCGGSLISRRHVLTSAHCVKHMYEYCVRVIVNTIDFDSGRILKIRSWISYDDWARDNNVISEYTDNDIAIVTLLEDVEDIAPAVISKLKRNEVIGRKVITAGWGLIDEPKFLRLKSLQKATLEVLTREEVYRNEKILYDTKGALPLNTYFTAANPPVVTTCGDSGGPLLLASTKEIVGINDSACDIEEPEKNPHAMSVHLVIDEYRDFIESVINDNRPQF